MAWTAITGSIDLSEILEDTFLSHYEMYSHYLRGSEGGLNITFTYTNKKNWSSTAEDDYHVEPIKRISGVFITGALRNTDADDAEQAAEAIEEMIATFKEKHDLEVGLASFIVNPRSENYHYSITLSDRHVALNKVQETEDLELVFDDK